MSIIQTILPFTRSSFGLSKSGYRKGKCLNGAAVGPLVWNISPDEKLVERNGADSYIAYLIDGNRDTLNLEYGSPGIINNLYIPKLKNGMGFSMYGKNLDSAGDQKAIAMFRTIQYKVDSAR
jgi:hypothetical protein